MFQTKQESLEEAQIQARVAYEKDIVYRRWNTGHGGVYVLVTKETQPNPHLSDIPERDISTPSGKTLTLINPAYMTRQVHELEKQKLGVRGHITSLNPIRPENAPDSWETEALRAFERGEAEISSVEDIEGKKYMRLMRPLITEKGCLKCHAKQGYHEGDIRGGISVSIPMEPFWGIERKHSIKFALVYGLLWMVGLCGLGLGRQRLMRTERERRQAEETLQKTHDELARSNAELEQFANVASHDLQEPLRIISSYLQLLERKYKDSLDQEAGKYIMRAVEGSARMRTLINDLLLYSRVGTRGKPFEPTNCEVVLQEVLANLRIAIEGSGALVTSDPLPRVMADPTQLVQLFQNLIGNALKFRREESLRIHISAQKNENEWIFSVRDNGIGIESQYADRIFTIFQRLHTRSEYPGTGIRLAICKKIIDRDGGRIWVDSEPGKGSTFYFAIPDKGGLKNE